MTANSLFVIEVIESSGQAIDWQYPAELSCTEKQTRLHCRATTPGTITISATGRKSQWTESATILVNLDASKKSKIKQTKGLSEKNAKILDLMGQLKNGQLTSIDFFNRMADEKLTVKDLSEFKAEITNREQQRLVDEGVGGIDALHQSEAMWKATYAPYEQSLMSARKDVVTSAWEAALARYVELHPDTPYLGAKMDVGGWASEKKSDMRFEGDIDFSLIMCDVEDAKQLRDLFESELKAQAGLDMKAIDALGTAHRAATSDVYIGEFGAKWAEIDAIRRGKMYKLKVVNGKIVQELMTMDEKMVMLAVLENNEQRKKTGVDTLDTLLNEGEPKPQLSMEPGISLEFLRHVTTDAIHSKLTILEKLIKISKYVNRSATDHQAFLQGANDFSPTITDQQLIDFVRVVTELKQNSNLSKNSRIANILAHANGFFGAGWADNPDAALKSLGERSIALLTHNIEEGIRARESKLASLSPEEQIKEKQKMFDDLKTEADAFHEHGVEFPEFARKKLLELAEALKSKGGKGLSADEQKKLEEFLAKSIDNPHMTRLAMAIVWERISRTYTQADQKVDALNNFLDKLDNSTIQKLRDLEDLNLTFKGNKLIAGNGINIKAINDRLNGSIVGKIGNSLPFKAINLGQELQAYSAAIMSGATWEESFSNLGNELVMRRVPGANLVGAAVMAEDVRGYLRIGVEIIYLIFPVAAVPEGLYGMTMGAAEWSVGKYSRWQFDELVKAIYAGAKFEKVGTGQGWRMVSLAYNCPSIGEQTYSRETLYTMPEQCPSVSSKIYPQVKTHPVLAQYEETLGNPAVSDGPYTSRGWPYDYAGLTEYGTSIHKQYLQKVDKVTIEFFKGIIEELERRHAFATGSGYADIALIEKELGCSKPLVTPTFDPETDQKVYDEVKKQYTVVKNFNELVEKLKTKYEADFLEPVNVYCTLKSIKESSEKAGKLEAKITKFFDKMKKDVAKIMGQDPVPEKVQAELTRASLGMAWFEQNSEDYKKWYEEYQTLLNSLKGLSTGIKVDLKAPANVCVGRKTTVHADYDRDCSKCLTEWHFSDSSLETVDTSTVSSATFTPKSAGKKDLYLKVRLDASSKETSKRLELNVLEKKDCPELRVSLSAPFSEIGDKEHLEITAIPESLGADQAPFVRYFWSEDGLEGNPKATAEPTYLFSGNGKAGKEVVIGVTARTKSSEVAGNTIKIKVVAGSSEQLRVAITTDKQLLSMDDVAVLTANVLKKSKNSSLKYQWSLADRLLGNEAKLSLRAEEYAVKESSVDLKLNVFVQEIAEDGTTVIGEGSGEFELKIKPAGSLDILFQDYPKSVKDTENVQVCVERPVAKPGEPATKYSYAWYEWRGSYWSGNTVGTSPCLTASAQGLAGQTVRYKLVVTDAFGTSAEKETSEIGIIEGEVTPDCTYEYSDWSRCNQETKMKTRTVLAKTPEGCVESASPELTVQCSPEELREGARPCEYSYSPWTACDKTSGIKTRTVTSTAPEGCKTVSPPDLQTKCTAAEMQTPQTPDSPDDKMPDSGQKTPDSSDAGVSVDQQAPPEPPGAPGDQGSGAADASDGDKGSAAGDRPITEKSPPKVKVKHGAGGSASGTFPTGGTFNGMRISYSIAGCSLPKMEDKHDFTTSRTYTGRLGSGTMTLTGTAGIESGYGADITASVRAGDKTQSHSAHIDTVYKVFKTTQFNLTVPIPEDATSGEFSINMTGFYNAGTRGLVVSGSCTADGPEGEAPKGTEELKVNLLGPKDPVPLDSEHELTAEVVGGMLPYTYKWSIGNEAGSQIKIKVSRPETQKVTVTVTDGEGASKSATLEIKVAPIRLDLVGVPAQAVFATPLWLYVNGVPGFSPATTPAGQSANSGKSQYKFVWQSDANLEFEPSTSSHGGTAVTLGRTGKLKIWCEVLKFIEGAWMTIGETDQKEVTITPPEYRLEFNPADKQGKVGQEVTVKIIPKQPIEEKHIDYRWLEPGFANRLEKTKNASEIVFKIRDASPMPLKVLARVPHYGDDIAEITGTYTGIKYDIKIVGPTAAGPQLQVWVCDTQLGKAQNCGMKDIPKNQFSTFQDIFLKSEITPPANEVNYRWSVTPEGSCGLPGAGSELKLNCSNTGSYTVALQVFDKDKFLLGEATAQVSVSVQDQAVKQAPKSKAAFDKLQEAKMHAAEGRLDRAIELAGEAVKLDSKNDEAMQLGMKWLKDRQVIKQHIQKLDELLKTNAIGAAERELAAAQAIQEKYGPVIEAGNRLNQKKAELSRVSVTIRPPSIKGNQLPVWKCDPAGANCAAAALPADQFLTGQDIYLQADLSPFIAGASYSWSVSPSGLCGTPGRGPKLLLNCPKVGDYAVRLEVLAAEGVKLGQPAEVIVHVSTSMDDARRVETAQQAVKKMEQAKKAVESGQLDLAIKLAGEALKLDAHNYEAGTLGVKWLSEQKAVASHIKSANLAMQQKDPAKAEAAIVEAEKLHPKYQAVRDARTALNQLNARLAREKAAKDAADRDRANAAKKEQATGQEPSPVKDSANESSGSSSVRSSSQSMPLSTHANGSSLQLSKTHFSPGEQIEIAFTAPAGWPGDAWIGIVPSGIPHGVERTNDNHDITYQYLNLRTSGIMVFIAPSEGDWDFRLHDTDNYGKEIASIGFHVGPVSKDTAVKEPPSTASQSSSSLTTDRAPESPPASSSTSDPDAPTPSPEGTVSPDGSTPQAAPQVSFQSGNIGGTTNGPTKPTIFTFTEPQIITLLQTYHWNNGQGASPGTISIQDSSGKSIGSWQATGSEGQGGVPNANWNIQPQILLPAGTYVVIDSDNATWSTNAEADNRGFVTIKSYPANAGGADEEIVYPVNALGNHWLPLASVGGNFEKYARFSGNMLLVNIPENCHWGKTGLMSEAPMIVIGDQPTIVTVSVDPGQTTGFAVAFAAVRHEDVALVDNAWMSWIKDPKTGTGSIWTGNVQDSWKGIDKGISVVTGATPPDRFVFSLSPGKMTIDAGGQHLTPSIPWIQAGMKLYLHIFTHPSEPNLPSSLGLTGVKIRGVKP